MIQVRLIILVSFLNASVTGWIHPGARLSGRAETHDLQEPVKIGLLIPEPEALAAQHGAELAIHEANREGDHVGRIFQLVVRSTEGPWGTGSKESIRLVFDEGVVAIIGSLDGRNTHLVEQVAAKTRIACLSAWASEMTLSQAFVPWFFRCVPNDDQQAASLLQEIFQKRKITSIAVIKTDDYDSGNAAQSFLEKAASLNIPAPREFLVKSSGTDLLKILKEIDQEDTGVIVIFGKPDLASDIMSLLKDQNMHQLVFGSLTTMDDQKATGPDWIIFEGTNMVSSGHWFTDRGIAFQQTFREAYGYQPGAAAAYAYDGIKLIIEVIRKNGSGRDSIIDAFAKINYKEGVTGEIRFDDKGNRVGVPGLMTIKNGNPSVIGRDE